ncbi:MAG: hypothetical protein EOO45_05570 [Flavobacterium sp.]|nr:MAG: hypothetical protein EOO45_05570 [Flavobacterium sp.]
MMEAYRGWIEVSSELGKGSVFSLSLKITG